MNRLLIGLFALATVLVSPFAQAQSPTTQSKKVPLNYMFVQTGQSGSLIPITGKAGFYQLKLKNTGEYVHYFSDRPNRVTGVYPTAQFVNQWISNNNPNGFNKVAPNAALSALNVHLLKSNQVNIIVQLSEPSYNPKTRTMTYIAQILPGENNVIPMKHLDQVALFIDSYCASCVGQGF
ncbi:hypothetical protein Lmor_3133 [Legionella moravica]|uniref:Uncharacterized protein n=1 Tax=Legionella moravica TaxID=39962 RepID=A0A378JYH3_9GAMM|nr:hypothetical protein [Legionella moravica]KTD31026.1 hypothetical protein Lmor_3133 [Legionella moravica]STX63604.1 Uncharacterised protein [Legionella moravica]